MDRSEARLRQAAAERAARLAAQKADFTAEGSPPAGHVAGAGPVQPVPDGAAKGPARQPPRPRPTRAG